jgi:hypothetical protein
MARLYDHTVAELMVDAAAEIGYPATRNDVVAWSYTQKLWMRVKRRAAYLPGC